MNSDRELISAFLQGDEAAFEAFYRRHRQALFVYLLSLVRRREWAEELLQDTFITFLRHVERLAKTIDLKPYLVRTARSRAIDLLRKERREALAMENRRQDAMFRRRPVEYSAANMSVGSEDVEEALQRLPAEQREAVVLKAIVGLTFREIGELTGVAMNTVISRYRYACEKMQKALEAGGCSGIA